MWTAVGYATSADNANDVQVADLDGDGDLDIVSSSLAMTPLPGMKMMVLQIHLWTAADIAAQSANATFTVMLQIKMEI